jgi:cellulose synthase/poly-beta-1,6-N-acetylglucosamine synthase-like glycosyltransferase
MSAAAAIFWTSLALCLYAYVGYPVLVWIIGMSCRRRGVPAFGASEWPRVTLVFSAYNEQAVVRQKLENCLALDYPRDRLEVIAISDASTDRTDAIVQEYVSSGIRLLRQPVRRGQVAGQDLGAAHASGEILVLTDANSLYQPDALRHLIAPFAEPTVGAVVGRLRYTNPGASGVGLGEALYWKYEGALKQAQARAGALLFGTGAITAFRRPLHQPVTGPWHDHDTLVPLRCCLAGYQVVYAPEAVAWEEASTENRREFQRKVRTIMRDAKTFLELKLLLSPLRPWLAFHLISSKVVRWLGGLILLVLFAANAFLLETPSYRFIMLLQGGFYAMGVVGLAFPRLASAMGPLAIPAYFCLVNSAAGVALLRVLAGEKVPWTWEPRGGIT